jgi:putative flippase GtrA
VNRNFALFLVAGGIAAAMNWLSRFAYSRFMGLTAAVAAAYLTGMVTAYVLNRQFVFDRSGRRMHDEAGRFVLVNLFALLQVWAVTLGLVRYVFPAIGWQWHNEALAHAIGVASPLAASYFGHRYFTFARAR